MNDPLFNVSTKKYQLKHQIEVTGYECQTYPLIKANFWRIRKNILASLFKKTAEFFGSAKKSHDTIM